MTNIINDVTYRVVTVVADDGDLDSVEARRVAWNHLETQTLPIRLMDWQHWDTERTNYNTVKVWFRKVAP